VAFVVVMDVNTKTRKIIAHQEGESIILSILDGSQIKKTKPGKIPFVIWN
jgi:hypothetical protein